MLYLFISLFTISTLVYGTNCYDFKEFSKISDEKRAQIKFHSLYMTDFLHGSRARIQLSGRNEDTIRTNIELEDNIDTFLDPNTDEETTALLVQELKTYFELYNSPLEMYDSNELSFFYYCLQENDEIFVELAGTNFLWNNWPVNVYVRDEDNIFTAKEHHNKVSLAKVVKTSFPRTFARKEERNVDSAQTRFELGGETFIPNSERFVDNTPQSFIDGLMQFNQQKNQMELAVSRHHIIPLDKLFEFFNRFLKIQKANLKSCCSEDGDVRRIQIQMLNSRYLNYIRAMFGNLLTRGVSVSGIRQLYNSPEFSTYEKSLLNWNPGNLFFGPSPSIRRNDPGDNFETKSRLIVGEHFDELQELNNRLISLITKKEKPLMDQCEEYAELYFDLMSTFSKVNINGQKGLFGTKLDMKQWKKVGDEWEIVQPTEHEIEKNKQTKTPSTEDPGNAGMFNPVFGLGAAALLCSKANIRKRSVSADPNKVIIAERLIRSNIKILVEEAHLTPANYSQITSYVLNQLMYSNYTGVVLKNVNQLCSITQRPYFRDYESFESCYKTAIVGSTVVGSIAGCAAGAAAGTFVFPILGTATGCVTGMLGVGATSLLTSKAIARSNC